MRSGASVGAYEAHELRDGDASQYQGISVLKVVNNVNQIIGPQLVTQHFKAQDLRGIDNFMIELGATKNKNNLGTNALLGVSMACARAGAASTFCWS